MAIEKPIPPRQQHTPICPRCGYDQSGTVASWTDRCPMTGRCSECGLDFFWRQVLGEQAAGPPWSVEHGEKLTARRLGAGYMRAIRQRRFWKQLELVARVKPGRLAVFALLTLLVNHLLLAVVITVSHQWTFWAQTGAAPINLEIEVWLFPYTQELEFPLSGLGTMGMPIWPISMIVGLVYLVPTLIMCIFTQSMSLIGVRPVHLYRGAVYMLPATVPVLLGLAGLIVILAFLDDVIPSQMMWAIPAVSLAMLLGWPVVQVLRWRAFARHYLQLPHSNWIVLSMLIILGLVLTLATLAVFIYSNN